MSGSESRDRAKRRQLLVGLVIVALLAAGVVFTALQFGRERRKADAPATVGPPVSDGVVLDVSVLSIDPTRSEVTMRLIPVPRGSYGDIGFAKPVTLVIGTSNGVTEKDIRVGSPVTSFDFDAALLNSQVSDYPFDAYEAQLGVVVAVPSEGAAADATLLGGRVGPGAIAATAFGVVPTQLRLESVVHGYNITTRPKLERTSEFGGEVSVATIAFDIQRSGATRFFAVFVMALMWSISIGILWIALSVLFRRRQIEAAILSMFGIVLFALPNIRNVQPNAPPIGSLTDVLAFFWCESLVAACLVAMIVVFVRRSSEATPARPPPD